MPGQVSVRNGPAGSPAPLYSVAARLDCQAGIANSGGRERLLVSAQVSSMGVALRCRNAGKLMI
jgi:hypothetical protein